MGLILPLDTYNNTNRCYCWLLLLLMLLSLALVGVHYYLDKRVMLVV